VVVVAAMSEEDALISVSEALNALSVLCLALEAHGGSVICITTGHGQVTNG
jgi:hypothetical protein